VEHSGGLAVAGNVLGPAVAAVPDSGYRFVMWSDGVAEVVRSDASAADIEVTAVFAEDERGFIPVSHYDDLFLIGRYSAYPLDGKYELIRDIDMSISTGFEPIGTRAAPFRGVLRGNGYRIRWLRMNRPNLDDIGLFGYAENAHISGVTLEADITGRTNVGLLVGVAVNTIIDSCVTNGAARGVSGVGGVAGAARGVLISRVHSAALVDGRESETGGLAGAAAGSFTALSRFDGTVYGESGAGGLAGRYDGGVVQHSYNAGRVTGRAAAGGLAGELLGGAELIQCYSSGSVDGTGISLGGLVGALGPGGGKAADSYWDVWNSGRKSSVVGVGKVVVEMQQSSTYTGWDFDNVWGINNGAGYPWLRELPSPNAQSAPFGPKKARAQDADKPRVKISGRTMYVKAQPESVLRVRIIDMRGRVVAGYEVRGGAKLVLKKIPAGKYAVEIGERGRRRSVSTVVLK